MTHCTRAVTPRSSSLSAAILCTPAIRELHTFLSRKAWPSAMAGKGEVVFDLDAAAFSSDEFRIYSFKVI
jgi:hypothetical protein